MGWLPNRLPAACGLALERGVSLSVLAVAWLKRGESASRSVIRHARHVLCSPRAWSVLMAAVMIGVDPHKGSHTAVVIDAAEVPLGQLRVCACAAQADKLVAWATAWPERTWAVGGAGGLGRLLAPQPLAAGGRGLDGQPQLAPPG